MIINNFKKRFFQPKKTGQTTMEKETGRFSRFQITNIKDFTKGYQRN